MLEIPGFNGLRKVFWKDLSPGMIVIGGIKVNNGLPLELVNFPVLTYTLIDELSKKYHFLPNKEVVVAELKKGESAIRMSQGFKTIEQKINKLNNFRENLLKDRIRIEKERNIKLPKSFLINENSFLNFENLILDKNNSFKVNIPNQNIPSYINQIEEKILLSDILTGRLKEKFNLPEETELMLHLVVDYSFSMNSYNKLELVFSAVNSFYAFITECMLNIKINLYVFSEICSLVKFPLSGKEIERKNTNYSSFMKKILHHRNLDIKNKVILFTDGEPSDKEEAINTAYKMKKLNIDYTQIIFEISEERRTELKNTIDQKLILDGFLKSNLENFEKNYLNDNDWNFKKKQIYQTFTEIAIASGGNQIIIKLYDLLNLISVEVFDRYLGTNSLSKQIEAEQTKKNKEDINSLSNNTIQENRILKKEIKPFEFKKINRKI